MGCPDVSNIIRFQSTHPRGVRRAQIRLPCGERHISIHAPARGATRCLPDVQILPPHFNPRTREGCDVAYVKLEDGAVEFQSTHPRGVRLAATVVNGATAIFQSTHPRGVRLSSLKTQDIVVKFQSTHPRGVRLRFYPKNKQFFRYPLYIFFYGRRKPHFWRESRRKPHFRRTLAKQHAQ